MSLESRQLICENDTIYIRACPLFWSGRGAPAEKEHFLNECSLSVHIFTVTTRALHRITKKKRASFTVACACTILTVGLRSSAVCLASCSLAPLSNLLYRKQPYAYARRIRYYCLEGAETPTDCPGGSYCPAGTRFGTQYLCPVGTFGNSSNLVDSADCNTCTPG